MTDRGQEPVELVYEVRVTVPEREAADDAVILEGLLAVGALATRGLPFSVERMQQHGSEEEGAPPFETALVTTVQERIGGRCAEKLSRAGVTDFRGLLCIGKFGLSYLSESLGKEALTPEEQIQIDEAVTGLGISSVFADVPTTKFRAQICEHTTQIPGIAAVLPLNEQDQVDETARQKWLQSGVLWRDMEKIIGNLSSLHYEFGEYCKKELNADERAKLSYALQERLIRHAEGFHNERREVLRSRAGTAVALHRE